MTDSMTQLRGVHPGATAASLDTATGARALRALPSPPPPENGVTFVHVVGARPNFVKMAPIVAALDRRPDVSQIVVHTGQHYDRKMSDEVLEDLGFRAPDRFLGVGSGSHGAQTARVLSEFEAVLIELNPVAVVVAGDVNSTLAGALAAAKLGIPVAHVEAGLRSWDWSMPEEINRVVTDRLSDLLFIHSPEAEENLAAEGIDGGRVHYVGNTMIDSLRRCERRARARAVWSGFGLAEREYVLVTLHRPSNVDQPVRLNGIVESLVTLAGRAPIVFPVHPRTRARLEADGALGRLEQVGVQCIEPLGYVDFLSLQAGAGAIVTDSGGVQEEAAALGVACYTFRPNTERPVTLTHGTNVLLGDHPDMLTAVELSPHPPTPCAIPLWDGHAAERVADILVAHYALTRAVATSG